MENQLINQLFSNFEVNTIKPSKPKLNKEELNQYLTSLFKNK